ncbi:hypothetical protein [Thorsellia anophelis]|uniref:Uncharacterized protein n=1 Tax=Thorsellia anophelis DSM 18579 TaxID=1123402 RepID=A0A1I0FHP1_9GAMM|nr:hypothetical protein [Thorsellia anophelis]SET57526.1 hypothetical protein SAMN02583745_02771 [Thorsellia anophelis DSM 18579]
MNKIIWIGLLTTCLSGCNEADPQDILVEALGFIVSPPEMNAERPTKAEVQAVLAEKVNQKGCVKS